MTQRHKANLECKQKFVEALFVNDWEAMARYVTPDVELREPDALPFGGIHKGLDGFKKCWEMIPKISHVTERIETHHTYLTANPDHLFVELDFSGKRLDNGETISGIVMEKFEFRDGKISAIVLYWFNIPTDLKRP
jgi:ketosteroid isomerase-like protein